MKHKMKTKYCIGIDSYTDSKSKGSLITMKRTPKGLEVVKFMRWYDKHEWLQKLKVKFYLWRMTNRFARYYRNVTIVQETNEGIKTLNNYHKVKY